MRHHNSVRYYLGKYQRWFLELYGSKRFRSHMPSVEAFFKLYPHKKYLQQFSLEDLDDYGIIKRRTCSDITAAIEVSRVRTFFKWCIEHYNLQIWNLVEKTPRRPVNQYTRKNKKAFNSVEELKAILKASNCEELKTFIISDICDQIPSGSRVPRKLRKAFRVAAISIGLDYSIADLRAAIPKLRVRILQYLDKELRDALLLEAKPNSNSETTVNLASLDVGTPIVDSGDAVMGVVRIN